MHVALITRESILKPIKLISEEKPTACVSIQSTVVCCQRLRDQLCEFRLCLTTARVG